MPKTSAGNFENIPIDTKLAIIVSYVSVVLFVVKRIGKIEQNQAKCDIIKFGAIFPSKHENYDRLPGNTKTLHELDHRKFLESRR